VACLLIKCKALTSNPCNINKQTKKPNLYHITFTPQFFFPIAPNCQQHLLLFFFCSHHTVGEVVSHCGFDLHFPND
jgi:hypothetical protein